MTNRRLVVAAMLMVPLLAGCAGGGTAGDEGGGATPQQTSSDGIDQEGIPVDDTNAADRAPAKLDCGVNSWDDGSLAEKYCGDGSVTISVDDTTIVVDGATCEHRGLFTLTNFGTAYSDEKDAQGDYVGLVLEHDKKTPRISALEMTIDGKRVDVTDAKVTSRMTRKHLDTSVDGSLKDGRSLKLEVSCALT